MRPRQRLPSRLATTFLYATIAFWLALQGCALFQVLLATVANEWVVCHKNGCHRMWSGLVPSKKRFVNPNCGKEAEALNECQLG